MKTNNDKWIGILKRKVEEVPVSLDTDRSWMHMEQKIRGFYRIRLWKRAGLVAACAAAILGPVFFLNRGDTLARKEPVTVVLKYPGTALAHKVERPRKLADQVSYWPVTMKPVIEIREISPEETEHHVPVISPVDEQPAMAQEATPTEHPTKQDNGPAAAENPFYGQEPFKKDRKKMMVSASGLFSMNRAEQPVAMPLNDILMSNNRLSIFGIIPQRDVSLTEPAAEMFSVKYVKYEYQHRKPVAFGMYASLPLSQRWFVESGLFATRLSTAIYSVHTQQQQPGSNRVLITDRVLWFLGVPLKIRWNFVDRRYFTAYVSGGGAMEKCIYFGYSAQMDDHKDRMDDPDMELTARDMPLLWSVQTTLGAQYNIVGNVGIFAEPGVSFYFEHNSPVHTIRTDSPVNFHLNAGIRFTF
ncbi:MAG: hypothetical protein M0P40_04725 [Bacteroidales bacterium]|jgi:hypothetical protein|nr:hypothetical protein [Bacteroidales bacterium]MDD2264319.1 hypothetical protein [Bacteroidales bacterium]MDD2831553.1 hypothetical protein [Bacteroidales bacterium]MDD3208547.1 hypothetical protein [Bacteroidales bacterium]MDD3697040.1 hypothetical protein [Bacteroidales bacterium]